MRRLLLAVFAMPLLRYADDGSCLLARMISPLADAATRRHFTCRLLSSFIIC